MEGTEFQKCFVCQMWDIDAEYSMRNGGRQPEMDGICTCGDSVEEDEESEEGGMAGYEEESEDEVDDEIARDLKKLKEYGAFYDDTWHCLECGVDMGSCNPRQLCGKNQCDRI